MAKQATVAGGAQETLDVLFDGRLKFFQSRAGYRISIDSLLLAHFVTVERGQKVVDLGAGSGVIALALADLHRSAEIVGIELQPTLIERAARNVAVNGLGARVAIVAGDVRKPRALGVAGEFDVAACNPPYRKAGSGRISADDERQLARHELSGALGDFVAAAAFLLRNKGRMALVYPAARSADLISAMRQARIEPKRLRMVHSFYDGPASLALIEGVKNGRAGLVVEKPLTIYRGDKEYTDEALKIIAGARN